MSGTISASLMIQMRTALADARAVLLLPAVSYAPPAPALNQRIYRKDITSLRTGVK